MIGEAEQITASKSAAHALQPTVILLSARMRDHRHVASLQTKGRCGSKANSLVPRRGRLGTRPQGNHARVIVIEYQ